MICRKPISIREGTFRNAGRESISASRRNAAGTDQRQDALTSIFLFHELPPKVRRVVFHECTRILKPGGRLVLVELLQHGDQPDYDGLLDLFPQGYHEPYYRSYLNEDFGAMAKSCGLAHIRNVNAFISKVMVFDKIG